jgi:hypothetical protein
MRRWSTWPQCYIVVDSSTKVVTVDTAVPGIDVMGRVLGTEESIPPRGQRHYEIIDPATTYLNRFTGHKQPWDGENSSLRDEAPFSTLSLPRCRP